MKDEKLIRLIEVGELYYIKRYSQVQISEMFGYSRSKVSRMLKKCLDCGIVEININYPLDRVSFLEERIKTHFSLKDVLVLKDYYSQEYLLQKRYSKMASNYLIKLIKNGMKIGMGSGKTLYRIIDKMRYVKKKSVNIVQLKGMAHQEKNYKYDSPILIRYLSKKLNANYNLLYSPLYIRNEMARKYICEDKLIEKTLKEAKNVDIVLTGISAIKYNNPNLSSWSGYLEKNEIELMKSNNLSACMLAHFIKEDGTLMNPDLEESIIGISIEDLKNIDNVVLCAISKNKAKSVLSALKTNAINTLITNEELAKELISYL
ncbi:unnamed protein product [Brachyspira suanatina]|uniref:Sugar-binding domain-containing protein n=1 Tax=Brachyspira suanatina TaxID=381802 RepID=A0A0G4KAB0_9SPIR|nr:sugar-binding domain-containing protein [Brachyspira suanatina]CRF35477.1 unnamed protein product [Brachyspira suanatina]